MGLKDDIDRIARQEQTLIFPEFTENTAFELGIVTQTGGKQRVEPNY